MVDVGSILGRFWSELAATRLLAIRLVLAGSLFAFLIHAWHSLGIREAFHLLAKCPHLSGFCKNGQKMPRRSERSERSAFVLLNYYLLMTYLACGVFACFSVACLVLA